VYAIRIMTYHIHRCRGADGHTNPESIFEVIRQGAPDLVALQDVDNGEDRNQLAYLARQLGMAAYGQERPGGNAFLSYYPLRGVQEYDLEGGGCCLRADLDIAGKRVHIFNLRLNGLYFRPRRQIRNLLGNELLGNRSVACPVLVLGDFAGFSRGAGDFVLLSSLHRAPQPMWSATYPARFPLFSRDRCYLSDGLRIEKSQVHRAAPASSASTHLPMIYTVRIRDTRRYLPLDKLKGRWVETAPG
jgi:endonuclease/exonuclease/phosphatase family metal-dependent hydrolase